MLMSAGSSLGGQETVIHIAGKRSPGKEAARALARASCAPIAAMLAASASMLVA
jgi:hypothetical protein